MGDGRQEETALIDKEEGDTSPAEEAHVFNKSGQGWKLAGLFKSKKPSTGNYGRVD